MSLTSFYDLTTLMMNDLTSLLCCRYFEGSPKQGGKSILFSSHVFANDSF